MSASNTVPKKEEKGMVGGERKQLSEHNAKQSECTAQMKSVDTKKSGSAEKQRPVKTWYFEYALLTWTSSNSIPKVNDDLSRNTSS
jgi:hypothetical protein